MTDIKFTVDQTYPEDNGAITTPTGGGGGGWAVGTYSFKVVAWYSSDETEVDNAGVDRGVVAAWENIAITAGDKVIIPVSIDTTRHFEFAVYFQIAASYDETANGADVTTVNVSQTSATEWELTLENDATAVNLILESSAAEVELSPPATIEATFRQPFSRSYTGSLIKESFLDDRVVDSIIINANAYLSIGTNLSVLQRWMKDQVYLKIEDSNTGTTSYFDAVYGTIGSLSAFNTRTENEVIQIFIPVDAEDIA